MASFFLLLFVAHLALLRPLLQNGDSAVYNQQIAECDLAGRTTHVGYFVLGILFDRLLPFTTDLNMNVMVLLVGWLGLAALYATTARLTESRLAALATVPMALGLSAQLRGMLLSEVDGVSVAFVALSFACFQRGAALVAGFLFGFSLLVTPLSGPLLTVFVVSAAVRALLNREGLRQQVRSLLALAAGSLLVYLPPVAFFFRDYVYGSRGLLHAPRASASVPRRIAQSLDFITDQLGYMLPLYVVGALVCLASPRLWRAGQPALALLLSVLLLAVVGQRFQDVPVQLPNLVLLGMLPAIAFAISRAWLRVGLSVLFCGCLLNVKSSYQSLFSDLRRSQQQRELALEIRALSAPRAPILVGLSGFHESRMLERYASSPEQSAKAIDWRTFPAEQERLLDPSFNAQVWFFHGVSPTQVAPLLTRYSFENRRAGKRNFKVLIPRSE
ncbi:MAG TPA: hypothetical protein VFK05_39465 [Polyangiaceae bacterium]|nr:hypothetical protein [Polyangiaceae bacterium]